MSYRSYGYALPTILITSTVMILILLVSIQASISVTTGINTQHVEKLGAEALDSGLSMALACYRKNGNNATWNNDRPLRPNTDCTGATLPPTCPLSSTAPRCYVLVTPTYRTKFVVKLSYYYNYIVGFDVDGIVDEVRATSGTPVNRTTYNARLSLNDGSNFIYY